MISQFNPYRFNHLLDLHRKEIYKEYQDNSCPDLNQASFVLDSLEAMRDDEFDIVFGELVWLFKKGPDTDYKDYATLGKTIARAVLRKVHESLEVKAHNDVCDLMEGELIQMEIDSRSTGDI
ncbi:MAG: hypothetical protein Unbinned4512contig1001_8 [Prokaryotic dsDNA virus sp.]|nr:MAG: hypothetical protein Unbinned4512contig1001_8 [Prokaryotic dsDNA virus sp.]|tara:strand:+ start:815 stop:1180 length:366 start_codon:yes stop_codon:yes gene_type:complete